MAETRSDNRAENRSPREVETRSATPRPMSWRPPETLPQPRDIPGWTHRYIRTSMVGTNDPANVSSKFREGWEPVKASDPHYTDLMLMSDPNSQFKDNIEIGGLLLCKCPTEMMNQRAAYYRAQSQQQIQAVDSSFMRTNDPRMPLFAEKRSEVSFGSGNK